MEYINKIPLQSNGEGIVVCFLKKLKEFGENYPKDLYEVFKSARDDNGVLLKELLIKVLLKEQNNRCCYCMRNLKGDDEVKTLEHLIPNMGLPSKQHFEKYLNSDTTLNDINLCYAPDFVDRETTSYPPYPHTVAYQNLYVSCDGKFFRTSPYTHCNLFRGEKEIAPCLIFDMISDDVEYKPNGFVIWHKETNIHPTFDKLGLNDNMLRMIRRIWLYANRKGINPMELNSIQRNELLYKIMPEIEEGEFDTLFSFENDVLWEKLKKYDYFDQYNVKRIARQLINLDPPKVRELFILVSSLLKI